MERVASIKRACRLTGHEDSVLCGSFVDTDLLITGGEDGTVCIFDVGEIGKSSYK